MYQTCFDGPMRDLLLCRGLKQKIMINQKISQELFSRKTTTLAASRSVFRTVVVLNMQRFQFRSQSFVSFLIQDTLMEKGILFAREY